MKQNPDPRSFKDRVLASIHDQQVAMRPRSYFALEKLLAVLVGIIILIVSVAILDFIFFSLRLNGHESLLSFGPRGIGAFLILFPWPLLALDVLLVLFLETLVRRFRFGYRSPILYLLIGLLAVALAAGFALDRATSVNDDLLRRADHNELPGPFGDVYEHVRVAAPHERGIFRGIITSVSTSTISMRHDDGDTDTDDTEYSVILPAGFASSNVSVGERLYVAGDRIGSSTIRAFGVHSLPPQTK